MFSHINLSKPGLVRYVCAFPERGCCLITHYRLIPNQWTGREPIPSENSAYQWGLSNNSCFLLSRPVDIRCLPTGPLIKNIRRTFSPRTYMMNVHIEVKPCSVPGHFYGLNGLCAPCSVFLILFYLERFWWRKYCFQLKLWMTKAAIMNESIIDLAIDLLFGTGSRVLASKKRERRQLWRQLYWEGMCEMRRDMHRYGCREYYGTRRTIIVERSRYGTYEWKDTDSRWQKRRENSERTEG